MASLSTSAAYKHSELNERVAVVEPLPDLLSSPAFDDNKVTVPVDTAKLFVVATGRNGQKKGGVKTAKLVGKHRPSSANLTGSGTGKGKESSVEESLQRQETRPASEEAGLIEDWHPLGDSNPCSQTENLMC